MESSNYTVRHVFVRPNGKKRKEPMKPGRAYDAKVVGVRWLNEQKGHFTDRILEISIEVAD